jgi:hypothetical protein
VRANRFPKSDISADLSIGKITLVWWRGCCRLSVMELARQQSQGRGSMHDDRTLSRRLLLVSIPAAAMVPAANAAPVPRFAPSQGSTAVIESAADDPVFAAIARHSEAEREWRALSGDTPNEVSGAALERAQDALLAWLKTVPTTLDGAIATLEHAAVKYGDGFDDYANLAESAQYSRGGGGAGDVLAAGERFPAMIADVLRQLVREAADCAA